MLIDTLIGAWRPRAKVKEVRHPKFYLFDCGVIRALSRQLREPLEGAERGHLLETLLFNELRAHMAYANCGGNLSYYRTPSGTEVDFIWSRGKHNRALRMLRDGKVLTACYAIYLGDTPNRTAQYGYCLCMRSSTNCRQDGYYRHQFDQPQNRM